MKITKELLKEWGACSTGLKWFLQKFPQGGDVHEVGQALRDDKRYDDGTWLTVHVFQHFINAPSEIASYVQGDVAATLKAVEGSPNSASGNYSTAASSGYYSKAASSGNSSTAASSGNYSKAASSGDSSTAASSGNSSTAASSGNSSTAASSGNYSTAASSGDYSTAEAKGEKTIAMVAGCNGQARAGEKGAFALAWLDGEQMRIAVGVVGENGIKADVWYRVTDGALKEVQ
ncbi:putative metal-binding protein [Oxalobacteraceae bacterium GrIS 2.11]